MRQTPQVVVGVTLPLPGQGVTDPGQVRAGVAEGVVLLPGPVGSPTFGTWDVVRLDDAERAAVYLSEGLGHAFQALTDDATVVYLCSEVYNPTGEHGITPTDPQVGLDFGDLEPLLSPKDTAAPTLAEAEAAGALPRYEDCLKLYAALTASTVRQA